MCQVRGSEAKALQTSQLHMLLGEVDNATPGRKGVLTRFICSLILKNHSATILNVQSEKR